MAQGTLPLQSYFGPYFLQRLIAVGGMAEIYLARTKGLAGFEKQLALKVIHADYADDKTFVQMLVNEAKIAVGLNHHNVAQTFDLGHIGNRYFISMEYVDGMDLFQLLKRLSEQGTSLPIELAVYIVHEALDGLDYAHTKCDAQGAPLKIIHRDMSPQNLLCSRHGEVKIVDFGIAKAANLTSKTRAGVIKGKLVYMSPEQAWGDPVDHRTDLFSTGIMLYEALTGGSLYLEKNPVKLLEMVRKAEIKPPSHRRRDVSPELDALVMRALAPRPADRYQSAREFSSALSEFLHRTAPGLTEQQLGDLVDTVLAGGHAAADLSVSVMARDDFAVHEHSIIFSAEDMLSGQALSSRRPPQSSDDSDGAGDGARPPRARLILFENAEAKPFEVGEQFIIGRSGDLRLGDARVSRRHARIFLVDGAYHLEDLGSANSTFINEEKVLAPTRLRSGDVIRVGPFEMRFVLEDAPVSPPAPSLAPSGPLPPAPEVVKANPPAAAVPSPVPRFESPEPTPLAKVGEVLPAERSARPPLAPSRVSPIDLTDRRASAPTETAWLAVRFGDENLWVPVADTTPLTHDLVMGQARLAGEAGNLVRRADGYWLEPAPGLKTLLLNSVEVTGPVPVRPGDRLQLGPLSIDLQMRR